MYSFLLLLFMLVPQYKCVLECIDEHSGHCLVKTRACQRSDDSTISRKNVRTLKHCMNYAMSRNALAFNYSPPEATSLRRNKDDYTSNCQILSCPDIGFNNMVNDSAYDYYSLYKNLSQKSICVKNIGVFYLFVEKMNYIKAVGACQRIGGDLANVISEARTNALSLLIANRLTDWYKAAYVGLNYKQREGKFITSLGNHLSCYKYRAWGPGQPRSTGRGENCVLLDSNKTWKVVNCKLKFPTLCEIYPIPGFCWITMDAERNCKSIY